MLHMQISLALDSAGGWSDGKWVSGNSYRRDEVEITSSPLKLNAAVPIQVNIHSKNGPVMQGAAITNGCNMRSSPHGCFGPTQAENLVYGLFFLLAGLVLLVRKMRVFATFGLCPQSHRATVSHVLIMRCRTCAVHPGDHVLRVHGHPQHDL
jgi:hypothetical protein